MEAINHWLCLSSVSTFFYMNTEVKKEIHQLETSKIPVECMLKSVIKQIKLTRYSLAAGMVNSSTHQVKYLFHDNIQPVN